MSADDWGNTNDKAADSGWGDEPEPAQKESSNNDTGGWGDEPKSSDNNNSGGGGWGDAPKSNDWSDRGGGGGGGNGDWGGGSSRSNNRSDGGGDGGGGNGDWGGQSRSDDNHRGGGEDGEERPAPYKPEELDLDEEAKLQNDGVGENFHRYKEQKVTCVPLDIIKPIEKFSDVIESKLLLENVKNLKYSDLTPIQKWAMPTIINGYDLIGCAQTGSGKTAAFLLPILQTILKADLDIHDPNEDCQHPYCLVVSPTRELAKQIYTHAEMLSKDSIVKCRVIYGQIATAHLKAQMSRGCHVLVATPGRLKDFVQRGWIGFKNIKYIVLDEGDRLVDDGFMEDIRSFFNHESMPPKDDRQTLFFSATFKQEVQSSAKEYLKDDFVFLTVGRVGAANEDIKQEFIQVSRREKKRELKNILDSVGESDKTIVFTQTKVGADMLASFFTTLGLSSTSIHGDRHQSQREQAITSFKRGEKRFLISSPVGNRGLDLPKVGLVINYDLPDNIDEYVHRIGRTGRAGHTGRAISFYDADKDSEVLPSLISILEEAKQEIPEWMRSGGQACVTGDSDWPQPSTGNTVSTDDDWGSSAATITASASTTTNPDDTKTETTSNSSEPNSGTNFSDKTPAGNDWGSSSSGGWGNSVDNDNKTANRNAPSHSTGGSGGWGDSAGGGGGWGDSTGGGGGWGDSTGAGGESNSGSGGGGWNRDSGGYRSGRGSRPPRGGGRSFGGRPSGGDDRGPRNDQWNRSDSDGRPFRARGNRFSGPPGRGGYSGGRNDRPSNDSWGGGGTSNGSRNDKSDDGGWGSSDGGWGDSNPKRSADQPAGNQQKRHDNGGSGSSANNSNSDAWTSSGW